jgi:hypothetical protein
MRCRGKVIFPLAAAWVLAAAAAEATVYIDERFEGPVPPPGWRVRLQDGEWTGTAGGHPGRCARGEARPLFQHVGYADLFTPPLNVGVGRTVYCRFYYRGGYEGGAYYADWLFALSYQGASSFIASFLLPAAASWTLWEGSAKVNRSVPVEAWWSVGGVYQYGSQAVIWMTLDTAQIADEPFTAVVPLSLGRVRALFL